jgi:hypothetical protein
MILSIRSLCLNPVRFYRCRSAEHVSARVNSSPVLQITARPSLLWLRGDHHKPVARFPPRNLSTSRLALPPTRHAPRSNPHS